MMRCPTHGPRPSAEFKLIGKEVPHAGGEGARIDIRKHRCGEFVWRLAESQRRRLLPAQRERVSVE